MPTLSDLPTPALLVDLDRLEANLECMARRTRELGVALRPHVKTHKCVEVGRLQVAAGAQGISASTLHEARAFANAGFDNITWAYPMIPSRVAEAGELARRIDLGVVVDSSTAVEALAAARHPFKVWVKVDSGYHRAGVDPSGDAAVSLARAIAERGMRFAGLLSHSGHAYEPGAALAAAREERDKIVGLADRMRALGVEVPDVSVGSTPALRVIDHLDGVTEVRPGNYAYFDLTQQRLGSCSLADCALSVVTTVISTSADHAIIDAGALSLSKDPGIPPATMGAIWRDHAAATLEPDVHVSSTSQEHGKLNRALPVGTRLRVLENHSCLTAACFDRMHAVRGEEVVETWTVHSGRDVPGA